MTAAAAATVILDGVRAERWRILVGDDAHMLDQRVRGAPEEAYEPSFYESFIKDVGCRSLVVVRTQMPIELCPQVTNIAGISAEQLEDRCHITPISQQVEVGYNRDGSLQRHQHAKQLLDSGLAAALDKPQICRGVGIGGFV